MLPHKYCGHPPFCSIEQVSKLLLTTIYRNSYTFKDHLRQIKVLYRHFQFLSLIILIAFEFYRLVYLLMPVEVFSQQLCSFYFLSQIFI